MEVLGIGFVSSFFPSVSMAKLGECLGAMQMVPDSIPGGSIEMLVELNSGDSI